jgi:hypothetical protein
MFVPTLSQGGSLTGILGGIFGTGTGAGLAMLYAICSICMFLVGLVGFSFPALQNLETNIPDHDEVTV